MNRSGMPNIAKIRASSLLFNIVVLLIVLNNVVYQTKFQFNQPFFVFLIFSVMIVFSAAAGGWRADKWLYIILFVLFSYLMGSILLSGAQQDYTNRALFNFMAASVYLMLFFAASNRNISSSYFYAFSVIFVAGGVYIFLTSDRDLFNPNWYAMTLFYLFALTGPRERKWLVLVLAITFLGVYGSRGATVSAIAAFTAIVMSSFLGRRRYIISLGFLLLTGGMFYFVYYLHDSQLSGLLAMGNIADEGRGLGGREGALIEAFSQLVDSNYLGYGIGASTSFSVQDNIGFDKDVHVHFGLLDISLKFGLFGVLLVYFFVNRLIHVSNASQLPYVLGGLMTVLYYNGLATSHVGLNFLLYLLLGHALAGRSLTSRRQPQNILSNG